MKSFFLPKTELDERSFGTSLDPLLHGIAQGLAHLFPPIEVVSPTGREDTAEHLHEADNELADE